MDVISTYIFFVLPQYSMDNQNTWEFAEILQWSKPLRNRPANVRLAVTKECLL